MKAKGNVSWKRVPTRVLKRDPEDVTPTSRRRDTPTLGDGGDWSQLESPGKEFVPLKHKPYPDEVIPRLQSYYG